MQAENVELKRDARRGPGVIDGYRRRSEKADALAAQLREQLVAETSRHREKEQKLAREKGSLLQNFRSRLSSEVAVVCYDIPDYEAGTGRIVRDDVLRHEMIVREEQLQMAEKRVAVLEAKAVAREAALATTEQREEELRRHSSVLEQVVRQSSSKSRVLAGQSDRLQAQHNKVVAKTNAALEEKVREVAAAKGAGEVLSAKCVQVRWASRTPSHWTPPLPLSISYPLPFCSLESAQREKELQAAGAQLEAGDGGDDQKAEERETAGKNATSEGEAFRDAERGRESKPGRSLLPPSPPSCLPLLNYVLAKT